MYAWRRDIPADGHPVVALEEVTEIDRLHGSMVVDMTIAGMSEVNATYVVVQLMRRLRQVHTPLPAKASYYEHNMSFPALASYYISNLQAVNSASSALPSGAHWSTQLHRGFQAGGVCIQRSTAGGRPADEHTRTLSRMLLCHGRFSTVNPSPYVDRIMC